MEHEGHIFAKEKSARNAVKNHMIKVPPDLPWWVEYCETCKRWYVEVATQSYDVQPSHAQARSCLRKKPYKTQRDAQDAAYVKGIVYQHKQRAYKCRFCEFWHLASDWD